MTDQPSREGPTLSELANIARAGNIAGIDSEWLASTLQAAEAERDAAQDLAARWCWNPDAVGRSCGKCPNCTRWERMIARAETAEARESALREAADELREAAWTYRHHVNPPTVSRAFDEAGREYDRVTNRSTRSLSTQEPTR